MSDSKYSASGLIGIIGSGTMGAGIGQVAAMEGHKTLIYDANPEALKRAASNLHKTLESLVEKGKLSREDATAVSGRIKYVNSLSEFAGCDLVIEAIVEQLEIKQKVFSELENICGETAILASNTSSLSITSIAAACRKPDRVLGVHFFNPAPLMPLVEIVPGLSTGVKTLSTTTELIRQWKKTVVIARDTPGFIVNRVARPFYGESIRIYEEGCYGLPEGAEGFASIDWALKEVLGFKMGPFELMDLIGNDINYKVTETVWNQFYNEPRYRPSLTQKRLVEAGRLGRKSGTGYYDYSPGAKKTEPVKDRIMAGKIADRVLAMLINEAVDALYLRIASAQDIDLAMTKGVNYPKGLLQWCDDLGAGRVLETMNSLRSQYEEDRYRPGVLLKQLAAGNKKIFS